jgi:hypothetical protein
MLDEQAHHSRMKLLVSVLLLMAAATNAADGERILNLRDVTPRIASAAGKALMLSFDGPVPQALASTTKDLAKTQGERVEVRYGKDLVGYAWLRADGRRTVQAKPTVALTFETAEQAKAAEQVLKIWDAKPTPLGVVKR